ncbi:uncharacterized protein NECHADRAFT_74599 [Fusarium vanettenii 77-13-4]|uniref:Nucleotide exchange factor SIL1 n=1 Tax=Fusarium vanettenii (strain ATCC MYA-4622 / CBS 123669 / FGSC 9596 / NRRL 45880 / 77-13-4) TaxID=660122 RepID=C7YKG3_FUSV7|nr:uncharacterized protein NECHADRAFT_74599 [Fusarium vanettenii 77-13-4]EEU47728.1 hypothetical protein NECHADRAFT_74599 [Fusarium vanettenii 77-13-4]
MTPFRVKSLPLALALIFGILTCILAAPTAASKPSPSADVDLICHTDNPQDCYPRVFQPTDEFQIVHDDQELPHGLHVRLNMSTGKKEAKINVPDESDPALEGLPVDQAVIVVDPEQPEAPQIPKGAPVYDAIGKIKEPEGDDYVGKPFFEAMKLLRSGVTDGGKEFDDALAGMEELSHDIYYGLKVTEEPAVLKSLFCIMVDRDVPFTPGVTPRDQQAAAILGSALQNNAAALKEVTKEWPHLMETICPKTNKPLREGFYSTFIPNDVPSPTNNKILASKVKARVGAINGLLKSDLIREDFLANDGMRRLLELLTVDIKEWAPAHRKVGQLVLDTFLDEDMGAKLGQWPRTARATDAECRVRETQIEEGCWDYHVARIMKANKRDSTHWSRDLNDRLAALRKSGKIPPRVEL